MNRLCKGIILFASFLLLLSCGGPKDGKQAPYTETQEETYSTDKLDTSSGVSKTTVAKPDSSAETQRKTDSSAKQGSLPEVKKHVVSVPETSNKTSRFPEWILIVLILAEGVCIVWGCVELKKIREKVGYLGQRLSRYGTDIEKIKEKIAGFENELTGSKNKTILNTPQQSKPNNPRKQEPIVKFSNNGTTEKIVPTQPPETADSEYIYVKHFKEGILEVAPKEQAFFQVTFEVGSKEGCFEFIGDVRKAIANKNSILDDVCETLNFNRNATQINTNNWGKCVKQQDGRWKVTQKAKLSFK